MTHVGVVCLRAFSCSPPRHVFVRQLFVPICGRWLASMEKQLASTGGMYYGEKARKPEKKKKKKKNVTPSTEERERRLRTLRVWGRIRTNLKSRSTVFPRSCSRKEARTHSFVFMYKRHLCIYLEMVMLKRNHTTSAVKRALWDFGTNSRKCFFSLSLLL